MHSQEGVAVWPLNGSTCGAQSLALLDLELYTNVNQPQNLLCSPSGTDSFIQAVDDKHCVSGLRVEGMALHQGVGAVGPLRTCESLLLPSEKQESSNYCTLE